MVPDTGQRGRQTGVRSRTCSDGKAIPGHTQAAPDRAQAGVDLHRVKAGTIRCTTGQHEWYTHGVPTTRPRHQVTETDELAAALDQAAARWPELSRGQLITRLALEGHQAALLMRSQHRDDRRDALRRHRGALTGVYPTGHLHTLRQDWPE